MRFALESTAAPDLGLYVGSRRPEKRPDNRPTASAQSAPINQEAHLRSRRRLENEPRALAWLEKRGLTRETISRFGLGIASPYPQSAPPSEQTTGAITSPVIDRQGRFLGRSRKTAVPGLTTNPRDRKGWSVGSPMSYWNGPARGKTALFVAEGMKDLWRISEEIEDTSLDGRMAIVSSTHGSGIPAEWEKALFWSEWDEVYLGHDNYAAGERIAQRIRGYAFRDIRRVQPPRNTDRRDAPSCKAPR